MNKTLLLFFSSLFLFVLSNSGRDHSEGWFDYALSERLLNHGKLYFDLSQSEHEIIPGLHTTGPDGKIYNHHEIGNTLFALPSAFLNIEMEKIFVRRLNLAGSSVLLAKQFTISFLPSLYLAAGAALFYQILILVFLKPHAQSLLATLALIFTTYYWPYSKNMYDGVLCVPLLLFSFLKLCLFKNNKRFHDLILSFSSLGLAFITRTTMIFSLFASAIYLCFILKGSSSRFKVQTIFFAAIPLIPFIFWQGWYNHLRTGHFYTFPLMFWGDPGARLIKGNHLKGMIGLLFSPGKSFFVYAPLTLLSIYFFKQFLKKNQPEAWYIAVLSICWFLFHAGLKTWEGAWGWGPRYFITLTPFAFLPAALYIDQIKKGLLLVLTFSLAIWGFLLSFAGVLGDWHYRMACLTTQFSEHAVVWNLKHNQAIDMVRFAYAQLFKIPFQVPVLENYSRASALYSSDLNLWPFFLIRTGMPAIFVWSVYAFICCGFIFYARRLFLNKKNDPFTV